MNRAFLRLLLFLTLVVPVAAQPPAQTAAWDVTLKTNTVANSNLEVVNRCKKNHQFQIQTTNLPFLHFSSTQLSVKGGGTQLVAVKFDSSNLAPGVYQGTVLVTCQSCKGEATCTQDREVLQVVLRATSDSPVSGNIHEDQDARLVRSIAHRPARLVYPPGRNSFLTCLHLECFGKHRSLLLVASGGN